MPSVWKDPLMMRSLVINGVVGLILAVMYWISDGLATASTIFIIFFVSMPVMTAVAYRRGYLNCLETQMREHIEFLGRLHDDVICGPVDRATWDRAVVVDGEVEDPERPQLP